MELTSTVTARVPREIKRISFEMLNNQGITPSEAINRLLELVATKGHFPEDVFPNPHALPEPGTRCLDPEHMTTEQRALWESLERHMDFEIRDWGDDLNKPYKQIIAEGRQTDYEAFS